MKHVKILSNKAKPTLFFIKHDGLELLIILDGKDNKKLHFKAFETFKLDTIELLSYEV